MRWAPWSSSRWPYTPRGRGSEWLRRGAGGCPGSPEARRRAAGLGKADVSGVKWASGPEGTKKPEARAWGLPASLPCLGWELKSQARRCWLPGGDQGKPIRVRHSPGRASWRIIASHRRGHSPSATSGKSSMAQVCSWGGFPCAAAVQWCTLNGMGEHAGEGTPHIASTRARGFWRNKSETR